MHLTRPQYPQISQNFLGGGAPGGGGADRAWLYVKGGALSKASISACEGHGGRVESSSLSTSIVSDVVVGWSWNIVEASFVSVAGAGLPLALLSSLETCTGGFRLAIGVLLALCIFAA